MIIIYAVDATNETEASCCGKSANQNPLPLHYYTQLVQVGDNVRLITLLAVDVLHHAQVARHCD